MNTQPFLCGLDRKWQGLFLGCALVVAGSGAGNATPSAPASSAIVTLAPILVTGIVPGPALWKVSKGDHVMWILGTVTPLPRAMHWDSSRMQSLIRQSQEVIELPGLSFGYDLGFWKGLALLPTMVGVEKLPNGKTLKDVLPTPLYSRWEAQKDKYLTGISGWHEDRLRPVFAADELYAAAIKANGLTDGTGIQSTVVTLAEKDKVPVTDPVYYVMLKDVGAAAKRFKRSTLNDQECLANTLDAIEHGLTQTSTRANAWATGDIATLRAVYSVPQQDACLSVILKTPAAAVAGLKDGLVKARKRWIAVATAALQRNRSTIALLPMSDLFAPDGYLVALRADGCKVSAPAK